MAQAAVPIVVIDDDQWLAQHVKKTLDAAGYTVSIANNAIDAIDVIDDVSPKAIVLDVFMPGPNGIVLLHELQSHSDLSEIPVILCSNSITDLPDSLRQYGVRQLLDKTTMHPEDIVASVKKVLA